MSYGDGVITFERGRYRVRLPIGGGKYRTIATDIETEREARQLLNAARQERRQMRIGITLRQVGAAWLHETRDQKSWKQVESQWRTIVLCAPFADAPVSTLTRSEVDAWARKLPEQRKKRSVLIAGTGKRKLIEMDEPISRKSATLALGYLSLCLQYAVREKHAETNAAADVSIPIDRDEVDEPVSYLSAREVDLLLGHSVLTFEQRTVFTISVFQGLREGELAGMDWARVDWEGRGWWVAKSWGGTTKNRKTRWQALVERAEQALLAWWEAAGRPTRGIVFPSPRLDDHDKPKRYAKGHDWGWADNPEHHVTRLGLWRRVGIRTRIRFHDMRDTCATHLLSGTWSAPWPIKMVSEHIGHSSTAVTEARYAHTTREALRRHAAGVQFPQTPAAEPAAAPSTEPAKAEGNQGSGGRTRTYDQSVNSRQPSQSLRVVEGGQRTLRQVWLDRVLETAEQAASGGPVDVAALREAGFEMLSVAAQLSRGDAAAVDVAIELAAELSDLARRDLARRDLAPNTGARS